MKIKVHIYLLIIAYSLNCSAQSKIVLDWQSETDKALYLTYNCQFEAALKLAEKNLYQGQPTIQWQYFKGMILFREGKFKNKPPRMKRDEIQAENLFTESLQWFRKVISSGEELLKKNPEDTTALFFTGAAYGYVGIYFAKKGDTYLAAEEGKKGLDYHSKLIELCPHWTDVYLSEGLFNLYASDVPWYLKPILWILGRSGDEEKAIRYLTMVSEKGHLAKYEAMEALLEFFMEQNNSISVQSIYNKLVEEFPGSRFYYCLNIAIEALKKEGFPGAINFTKNEIVNLGNKKLSEYEAEQYGLLYIIASNYYINQKNYSKAIYYWKELIDKKILPKKESAFRLSLGDIYLMNNEKNKAINSYTWVVENSDNPNEKNDANEKLRKLRLSNNQ